MLKAGLTTKDGKKLALLGITEVNVQKLKEGKPINVSLKDFGIEGEVIIVYGKDEKQLRAQLSPMIGPDTQMGIGLGIGSFVKANKDNK